jgi:hypothetical protein
MIVDILREFFRKWEPLDVIILVVVGGLALEGVIHALVSR